MGSTEETYQDRKESKSKSTEKNVVYHVESLFVRKRKCSMLSSPVFRSPFARVSLHVLGSIYLFCDVYEGVVAEPEEMVDGI